MVEHLENTKKEKATMEKIIFVKQLFIDNHHLHVYIGSLISMHRYQYKYSLALFIETAHILF